MLLDGRLRLTEGQKANIGRIDSEWTAYRDSTRNQMERMQQASRSGGHAVTQISEGLQEYSAMSREYDATRQRLWQKANAYLSPEQRAKVDTWRRQAK